MTSSEPASTGSRTSVWRTAIVAGGIGIAALAFVVGGLTQRTDDDDSEVPGEILALLPEPGTVAFRQDEIGAALQPLLVGTVSIDGREIPEDQIEIRELGTSWQVTFRPGEGKAIEELEPGNHRATILWWSSAQDRPDADGDGLQDDATGSYSWEFIAG